jgi:hypothetical protein
MFSVDSHLFLVMIASLHCCEKNRGLHTLIQFLHCKGQSHCVAVQTADKSEVQERPMRGSESGGQGQTA